MNYTLPLGDAAHFEFVDSAVYTPPAGSAAAFNFVLPALRPFGVNSTRLGTPVAASNFRADLVGFSTTQFGFPSTSLVATGLQVGVAFGTPHVGSVHNVLAVNDTAFGSPTVIFNALGLASTNYGTPNSPYPQTGVATGEMLTLLPTPRLVQRGNVYAALPSTVIPQAFTAVNQTTEATGASTTRLGTPVANAASTSIVGTLATANGFSPVLFGTPVHSYPQTGEATGATTTQFGAPVCTVGAHIASGFRRTRIGRVKAASVIDARYASGFASGGVGAPTGALRNRVQSMSIIGAFGTPTVTRSTAC